MFLFTPSLLSLSLSRSPMGMIGNEEEKSQLAKRICEFSARATTCANLHHPRTNRSPFINWYLVLNVDENADVYSIRKQYHKLALQLHPDKNSNSEAETAFKLVSEAHFCLSDSTRRRAFDTERKSISCIKCNPNSCSKTEPRTNTQATIQTSNQQTSRNSRLQVRLRELRSKLKEEATIIEKCLIANAASRKEPTTAHKTRKESPIFNPLNYQQKSYPHHLTPNHKKLQELREALKIGSRSLRSTENQDYPIFQCRTERVSPMSRCASTRNH